MDGRRFDDLARAIAGGRSRRTVVKGLGATLVAAAGITRAADAEAVACRPDGSLCTRDAQCCAGTCNSSIHRCNCSCTRNSDCIGGKVCQDCMCVTRTPTGLTRGAVFAALTSPEGIAALGFEHDAAPVVGHRFTLQASPRGRFSGAMQGQVLSIVPEREIVIAWKLAEMADSVEVRLRVVEDGTGAAQVEVSQSGDPEVCRLAEQALGRGWQERLLRDRLTAFARERAAGS